MTSSQRVYVHGRDGVNWSIDHDHSHARTFLQTLGHTVTPYAWRASIIHSVWWNNLSPWFLRTVGRKAHVVATASNEIDTESPTFRSLARRVHTWIAPSRSMYDRLVGADVRVEYQPFYVDERLFQPTGGERRNIAANLGIAGEISDGEVLIGSFQRDTQGADLVTPKPQKGADRLVRILDHLPRTGWRLVLAGPRRHFILRECRKRGIPHVFVGQPPAADEDDLLRNSLSPAAIARLYQLVDAYVVTSRSEGGPKAVLESCWARTMIYSTPVGLAPDILAPASLCESEEEMIERLMRFVETGGKSAEATRRANLDSVRELASFEAILNRWGDIYARMEAHP